MAFQGILHKTCTLLQSTRFLLANRLPQITQTAGIKHRVIDQLKNLNVPEKPKRPLTPFFKYLRDHREAIMKQYPSWKITQVSAQCASDWRNIDASTKQKYETEYQRELDEFVNSFAKYKDSLTEEQKEALKQYSDEVKASKKRRERRKKLRENDKPKRPLGAYFLYVAEQAKTRPGKRYFELLVDLKESWANMAVGEKAPYQQAAARAKEQYDIELKEWELKMIKEGNEDLVRQSTLTGKSPKPKKEQTDD